ncbi:MAG: hypothetical protein QM776_10845 [Rhodocyclaceae bacterium]
MNTRLHQTLLAVALASLITACSQDKAATTNTTPAVPSQEPVASFQELMKYVVDPTADDLWNAVSSEITKKGIVETQPRNDEEWEALRRHAFTLIEAGNLLTVEGRPIVHGNATTSETPEEWGPEQIAKAFAEQRPQLIANAKLFRDTTQHLLAAIDARDVKAYSKAGAELDAACEACHVQFWYPDSVKKHRGTP